MELWARRQERWEVGLPDYGQRGEGRRWRHDSPHGGRTGTHAAGHLIQ